MTREVCCWVMRSRTLNRSAYYFRLMKPRRYRRRPSLVGQRNHDILRCTTHLVMEWIFLMTEGLVETSSLGFLIRPSVDTANKSEMKGFGWSLSAFAVAAARTQAFHTTFGVAQLMTMTIRACANKRLVTG